MSQLLHPELHGENLNAIKASLMRIARRQTRVTLTVKALKTLHFVTFCYIPVALIAGLYFPSGHLLRILLGSVAWAVLPGLALMPIRRVFRRPDLVALARQIERQFPSIQERISTTLELSNSVCDPYSPSLSLRAHVAQQAQLDAAGLNAGRIIPLQPIGKWMLLLLIPISMWSITLTQPALRQLSLTGLFRLAFPLQDNLPDSLADLSANPGDVSISEGQDLTITAKSHAARVLLIRDSQPELSDTRELRSVAPTQWNTTMRRVFHGFRYKLTTSRSETRWFNVTVQPVLAIQSIAIRYDYPRYTALAPKTISGLDAAIDALSGTRATLSVVCSHPLDSNHSGILLRPDRSPQKLPQFLAFQRMDDHYRLTLPVDFDATYTFTLISPTGVRSSEKKPRRIIARPDQLPSIVILSPDPQISARPDDIIPIRFIATDDFAISKIEQLIQVNGTSPVITPVSFDATGPRNVNGPPLTLSLADVLDSANSHATDVRYQLRVTDNRDPNPQTGLSLQQSIHVDPAQSLSFEGTIDQALARSFEDIITNTIRELDRAKPRLIQSKTRDGSEPLGEWQRKELQQAAKDLPGIAERLGRAAGQAATPTFLPVARQLTPIAQGPLRTAAEQAARAELNIDIWAARNDALTQSIDAIAQARARLQSILDSQLIAQRRNDIEAGRDLASAEKLEHSVAQSLSQNQTEKAAQLQRLASIRLRQAIRLSPALDDPAARRLAELLQKTIRAVHAAGESRAPKPDQLTQLNQDLNQLKSAGNEDLARRAAQAIADLQNPNPQDMTAGLHNAENHLRGIAADPRSSSSSAAQSAQEAAQAQNESSLINPQATAQAIAALGNAASALRRSLTSTAEAPQVSPRNLTASETATTHDPSTSGPLPASIRDLGITPDQWLKFTQAAQKNVLSTSQQQGPMTYRRLIQDYYTRLAQLPANPNAAQTQTQNSRK